MSAVLGGHEQLVHEGVLALELEAEAERQHGIAGGFRSDLDQEDAPEGGVGHQGRERPRGRMRLERGVGVPIESLHEREQRGQVVRPGEAKLGIHRVSVPTAWLLHELLARRGRG